MTQPDGAPQGQVERSRKRFAAITGESERTILLGIILLATAVSAALGYILTQYYSADVVSSLVHPPEDCLGNWGTKIGRHCFSDYGIVVDAGARPDPWGMLLLPGHQAGGMVYPAAGMLPQLLFGLPAKWLGAPQLGLIFYLLALTAAVLAPAVWAARGTRGLERVVVFLALGAAAIPAWMVVDRGNSAGFVVPVALVFLIALCRQRWGLVAVMVVLVALVKPQFSVLAVALLAARQWRLGGLALGGVAISNLAAYLLWPRDFPETIGRSIHNLLAKDNPFQWLVGQQNVSFGKALLMVPDTIKLNQTGGKVPDGFLAGPRSLIGYAVLALVVASVVALGRRIPPVMAGIVLLATAALFPPLVIRYYLIFVLPVAALIVRDPDGPPGTGIFERLARDGGRRRAVGICVSLAVALSIAQIPAGPPAPSPVSGQPGVSRLIVITTVGWAPILWLIAIAVIIVSYARRPAVSHGCAGDQGPTPTGPPDTAVSTSSCASEPMTE
ncbi:glycosyltransferase 87 family protein [Mycobacterium paraseoulense]|uniref:DUF2029 domain-containing protein n=1 Tax=Mycobacterium paraseoulense TaxID=590652 RepID=A0A1X0I6X4_9MYCO|nr:glycosyltransferase 87 family protein [Mycobacterium paraseoulense]MCV7396932.1 DUF2029 domain-containing protein [Mycobacterium paraseoulense]ORB37229.1 hypothetical protein BST39_19325 [Mycobacterium paraseoulense]BBZ69201.1 membrane protein [Mycobacterium paraseoulense]